MRRRRRRRRRRKKKTAYNWFTLRRSKGCLYVQRYGEEHEQNDVHGELPAPLPAHNFWRDVFVSLQAQHLPAKLPLISWKWLRHEQSQSMRVTNPASIQTMLFPGPNVFSAQVASSTTTQPSESIPNIRYVPPLSPLPFPPFPFPFPSLQILTVTPPSPAATDCTDRMTLA